MYFFKHVRVKSALKLVKIGNNATNLTLVGIFFIYLFYHDFAKIYGPPQILQKYTSAAVVHSVTDITSWPTTVGAARSGPVPLTPRATTLCP
jgi:hypothetical protein